MKYYIISLFLILSQHCFGTEISGIITDENQNPISSVTVKVLNQSVATVANTEGVYRLYLKPGRYRIKFSHVAHYSKEIDLVVAREPIELDVALNVSTVDLGSFKAYTRLYDPAQQIIVEAIKNKDAILSKIQRYRFKAYTKFVLNEDKKNDSSKILLLTETLVSGFWKYPDSYKEIITSRKQSANIDPENNLVSVGGILNFNKNRLEINQYQIVTPTAKDALEHYNYYLLDTLLIDSQNVFLLEIEPKNELEPLFEGLIRIVDSTFDVVGVELKLSKGFELPFLKNTYYEQQFSVFEDSIWMPNLIKIRGDLEIEFPGIPNMAFDYTASLDGYRFNDPDILEVFDEVRLEVAKEADDYDSLTWKESQVIPLTEEEQAGYRLIDSLTSIKKPLWRRAANAFIKTIFSFSNNYDYIHFNRVEGVYVGFRYSFEDYSNRYNFEIKNGYAVDAKLYQQEYVFKHFLNKKWKWRYQIGYTDRVGSMETIISPVEGNPTLGSLFSKVDPYDYYYQKGWFINSKIKLWDKTRFYAGFNDYKHENLVNATDYSLFEKDKKHKPNLPINDGKLRSWTFGFSYDSRDLLRVKGKDTTLAEQSYTLFNIGVEYSRDDLAKSDFNFTRYRTDFFSSFALWGRLPTSINFKAGYLDGGMAPFQKYFVIDFGESLMWQVTKFHTLGETNFYGKRFVSAYAEVDFGLYLFQKSGLPLIQKIPFSLSIHGGRFWSEIPTCLKTYYDIESASKGYSEIGFGISRLPLYLRMYFTWQLTGYSTKRFNLNIELGL